VLIGLCSHGLYNLIGLCVWGDPAYAYKYVSCNLSLIQEPILAIPIVEEMFTAKEQMQTEKINSMHPQYRMKFAGH
jgi:hypothetical protein